MAVTEEQLNKVRNAVTELDQMIPREGAGIRLT
jgi:hypothetical protein